MLKNNRLFYLVVTLFVILLGILSRKVSCIPMFVGDVLYAVMVYLGCRFLLLNLQNLYRILLPLLFCFLIEFQQLANWSWLVSIRETTLGHYVLGQGFLWSDLLCYALGVLIAFGLDFLGSTKFTEVHAK